MKNVVGQKCKKEKERVKLEVYIRFVVLQCVSISAVRHNRPKKVIHCLKTWLSIIGSVENKTIVAYNKQTGEI